MYKPLIWATCLMAAVCAVAAEQEPLKEPIKGPAYPAKYTAEELGGYAIVVKASTFADPEWRAVVGALQHKYPGATIHTYTKEIEEVRAPLAKRLPRYTCIVSKPDDAGHALTVKISNLMRSLDDDIFVDSLWAILTGYTVGDALRIAEYDKPLRINRILDCAGCDLSAFAKGTRYSEDHRGKMKSWDGARQIEETHPCDTDNTQGVIQALVKDRVQMVTTSGHATQHDWSMGYCGPNMFMRHKDGQLVAWDTKQRFFPVVCPEPKVYLGTGNCLIGDIDKVDCMATSWMHTGGAYQFVGYTVTTWFGTMGWGTQGSFVDRAGLYSLTEAFHFNNTRIVAWLYNVCPPYANLKLPKFGQLTVPRPSNLAEVIARTKVDPKDISGYLHDRDVVALYGDPAWDARPTSRFSVKTAILRSKQGYSDITITATPLRKMDIPQEGLFFALPGSFHYKEIYVGGITPQSIKAIDNMLIIYSDDKLIKDKPILIQIRNAKRLGIVEAIDETDDEIEVKSTHAEDKKLMTMTEGGAIPVDFNANVVPKDSVIKAPTPPVPPTHK